MAVDAVQDANQNFSPVFARGTLGTADVKGTSGVVAGAADPLTGAQYVYNLAPAGSLEVGSITVGNIDQIGTVTEITNGTIRVTDGTVKVVTPGTITSGTVSINAGTIGAGTLNTLGTVSNILAGTIQNSGTVTGVGVVSNITNGSIVVTAGTVTTTMGDLSGGTIDLLTTGSISNLAMVHAGTLGTVAGVGVVTTLTNLANGTIQNSGTTTGVGTISNIAVVHNAGTVAALPDLPGGTVDVVSNITNGSIVVTAGTVTTNMGDLSGGTIDEITNGSIRVTAGTVSQAGAWNVTGTIANGSIAVTAGTIGAGTLNTLGTVSNILAGTIQNSGTVTGVGTVSNIGSITNIGMLHGGTVVTTMGDLTGGTIDQITTGSIVVTAGTVTTTMGDLSGGTIDLGTVVGKDANAAATTAFPVFTAGMDGGGTVYGIKVDTDGHQQVDVQSGTFNLGTVVPNGGTVGTVPGVGVVTTVSNVTNGSIRVTAGTITSGSIVVTAGTVETTLGDLQGGTIDLLTTGSISNVAMIHAGTLGTVTGVGVVSNLTNGSIAVTAGTITNLLKAEDAGHSTGDSGILPFAVRVDGGTSLVGTDLDYAPIQVDANGALRISGTVATGAGTQPVSIVNGTVTNVGTVADIGKVHNAGTIAGGTVGVVTTVSNLTNGSIAVTAGTITNLLKVEDVAHTTGDSGVMMMAVRNDDGVTGLTNTNGDYSPIGVDEFGNVNVQIIGGALTTVGQINTINDPVVVSNGTIRVTAGTVNSGTINAGTINSGTINAGTINSGTINAGTVTTQPYPASQVLPAYAVGTAAAGTLVAAVGAGTGIYVNSIALTAMSGTLDMCLSFGLGSTTNQVVQRGLYAPGQGVAISFDNPSFYGTANSALTYQILSGAGTASWAVTYNTKGTP